MHLDEDFQDFISSLKTFVNQMIFDTGLFVQMDNENDHSKYNQEYQVDF